MSSIGDFTLREEIGDDRHGRMWRAARRGGTEVLLRRIEIADDDHRARIERWLGQELNHPRLVAPHALITDDDGDDWLVQRWVPGDELSTLLPPDSPLSLDDRLWLAYGILEGLAYAHDRGVTHGNLSPRTVIVRDDGTPTLVGLLIGDGAGDRGRRDAYASPEARTRQPRTPASDVYSAAAVIEELLSEPVRADRPATAAVVAALGPVLSASRHADPGQRPADAERLAQEFDRVLEPVRGPRWWLPGGPAERSWSALGRRARVVALAVAAVLVVATGFGVVALTRATAPGAAPAPPPEVSPTASPTPGSSATTPAPSATPTPSPTPSATTTTAPPQLGFSGTYRRTVVVTGAVNSDIRIGKRSTTTWRVKSRCSRSGLCTSVVDPAAGRTFTLGPDLTRTSSTSARCIDLSTGQPNGVTVAMVTTEKLTLRARSGNRATTLVGTSTLRQDEACPQQDSPKLEVTKRVTLRRITR